MYGITNELCIPFPANPLADNKTNISDKKKDEAY